MPLKIKLKPNEYFWVNGIPLQNGNSNSVFVVHAQADVLTERHLVTEEQSHESPAYNLAHRWFKHLSGQQVLREYQCALLALECTKLFPDLAPIAREQKWFAVFNELLKRIR